MTTGVVYQAAIGQCVLVIVAFLFIQFHEMLYVSRRWGTPPAPLGGHMHSCITLHLLSLLWKTGSDNKTPKRSENQIQHGKQKNMHSTKKVNRPQWYRCGWVINKHLVTFHRIYQEDYQIFLTPHHIFKLAYTTIFLKHLEMKI